MALRFTQQALRDLSEVDTYLSDKSLQGLKNILHSLKGVFDHIESHPRFGRPTQSEQLRVAVEPDYKHVIPYYLTGPDMWILRVYHARRAPFDYEALKLP